MIFKPSGYNDNNAVSNLCDLFNSLRKDNSDLFNDINCTKRRRNALQNIDIMIKLNEVSKV